MTDHDDHPHQAESQKADVEKQSTPVGVTRDLEEEVEEQDGTTDPTPPMGRPVTK